MGTLANNTRYYASPSYVNLTPVYLPDVCTILVEAIGTGSVVLEMSMNTPEEIAAGAPSVMWYPWFTVLVGVVNRQIISSPNGGEFGPNAVRLNLGANTAKMWVKG